MAEPTPQLGTDMLSAQDAIKAMLVPEEENTTAEDALEAKPEAEEEAEGEVETLDASEEGEAEEGLYEEETEGEEIDEPFDLMSAKVDMDGEETTVEELRQGYLRRKDYTRKTQELAEKRKAFESEQALVYQERSQYAQLLEPLRQKLEQKEEEPDWDMLYDTDPRMAAKAEREWKKRQQTKEEELQAIRSEQQRIHQLYNQRLEQEKQQYAEQQRVILPDLIPEWRDPKVAQTEAQGVRDYLLQNGVPEEQVRELRDALMVKIARKAWLYDQGEKKVATAKSVKPKPRGKTLRSGNKARQPQRRSEAQKALTKAKTSGTMLDAAAAIRMNLLGD